MEYYKNVKEIEEALKISDLTTMTKSLSLLRTQLTETVSIRVDPTDKKTRPLVEFIQSCHDCSLIIDLWNYQANSSVQNLECLVPDIVSLFIRLCTTPILRAFGQQLVQSISFFLLITSLHMKSIYRGISSMRVPQCQSSFRVLIAICSFNENSARDLFQIFNFQAEGFARASRYRQTKKNNNPNKYQYDLRTFYVQFVLAFFIHGDSDIKKQVLSVKGLVNGIFTHIPEDAYQLIEEILNTMYKHLIMDNWVSRSLKANLFTSYVLEKIGKIYERQEPEAISKTETGIPADLVHRFLLSICTTPGVGVCFKDSGWYSIKNSSENNIDDKDLSFNRNLSQFILSIKPSDDMRQQELLLKILTACPGLVQNYWKNTTLAFEPRLSSKWLGNTAFLQKVIQLSVPSFYYVHTQLYPATPPDESVILENILPSVYGRTVSSKGLQNSSPLIRFSTINILSASFIKFNKVISKMEHVVNVLKGVEAQEIKSALDETTQDRQHILLPSLQWQRCIELVREGFRRQLPEIQLIVTLYTQYFGKNNNAEELVDANTEGNPEMDTQRDILQVGIFRLLRYYQECVPVTFMENKIEPSNLIPVNILSVSPSVTIHLLKLLLSLPDFRWSNKSAGTSVSHITNLLTLYLQTSYKHIRELTGKLVNKTLSDSFMFKHDADEVQLWLLALPKNYISQTSSGSSTMSADQEAVLHFLDDCFIRFGKAQYKYTDKLVDFINQTASKTNQGNMDNGGSSGINSGYTHPFSPLLLTLLEQYQFLNTEKTPLAKYICRLILLLQTKQEETTYLYLLFEKYLQPSKDQFDLDNIQHIGDWNMRYILQETKLCLDSKLTRDALFRDTIDRSKENSNNNNNFIATISSNSVDNVYEKQKQFVQILNSLPVVSISMHLTETAEYCTKVLKFDSYHLLVDYLADRHPLAGNLFSYPDLEDANRLEPESSLFQVLKNIPFHILFINAWYYSGDRTFATTVLKSVIANMDRYQLSCAFLFTLQHLAIVLENENGLAFKTSTGFILQVLQLGLEKMDDDFRDDLDQLELKTIISDHFAFKELDRLIMKLFYNLCESKFNCENLDIDLLSLLVEHTSIIIKLLSPVYILNSITSIDFDAFYKYCMNHDQKPLYHNIIKLLINLINFIKREPSKAIKVTIPSKIFEIFINLWQTKSEMWLEADIISFLDKESSQVMGENYYASQQLILNACCDMIVKRIVNGEACTVDLNLIQDACKIKGVSVASFILEAISSASIKTITSTFVQLVSVGFHLILDSETMDDGTEYLETVIKFILKALAKAADITTISDIRIEGDDDVYDDLSVLLNTIEFDWKQLDAESVRDFVLAMLLDNLSNASSIRFTTVLIEKVYVQYNRKEPIETYMRRILEHSQYQELTSPKSIKYLLKNESFTEEDKLRNEQRHAIIKLIHVLHNIRPSIFSVHQGLLDPLLTSYSATTSKTDRLILDILQSTEKHSKETILPKLLMWGAGSDKNRQAHIQAGTLLKASTISMETVSLIDPEMMAHTFMKLPILTKQPPDFATADILTYDPSFFIPLFANLIANGSMDCRRFIECNGLSLIIASLSSMDEGVRNIGYQVMDQFYVLLEHTNFRGKLPVKFLLDVFKNSIVNRSNSDTSPRLLPSVCLCVAQVASILLLPTHFMLPYINKWILQKPSFDFNHVPLFASVFNSTNKNYRKERLWILEVLSSSIQTFDDYKVFSRHQIWDLLATFYNSGLADDKSKQVIIDIIKQSVTIPTVAIHLIQNNGLLTWIHQILVSFPSSSAIENEITQWKSILQLIQDVVIKEHAQNDKVSERMKSLLSNQLSFLQTLKQLD
ncbi:ribosome 60S biogenesis N-terminal-domain-containing protein [Cunninghamella echinulata]|nr:ribosome 60S biogenesis N-terminal-domain-containing protein [Cunninghamella echinulata]